jgi:cytochrome c-type biogenesis protein CcmH
MIIFWIATALLSAAAALLIVSRAARSDASILSDEDPTLGVYRRQLTEIDDLADRGLLAEEERRSARTEAARRLLSAADQHAPAQQARPSARNAVMVVAAVLPLLAVGVYLALGSPGHPDQPFAQRLLQWRQADPGTLSAEQLIAVLQGVVAEHPTDPQPLMFLSRVQAASGDDAGGLRSLETAVRLAPRRADLWTAIGELLVGQAGGEVTADAQRAFAKALTLDPTDPSARYHGARARIASGDLSGGLAIWRSVHDGLPKGDPRAKGLSAEIDAVVKAGGLPKPVVVTPPSAGPDQAAFIRSMVDGLAARLKASPDDPAGWARLVRSYGVLGETEAQAKALAQVRQLYRDRPEILKTIEDSAASAPK